LAGPDSFNWKNNLRGLARRIHTLQGSKCHDQSSWFSSPHLHAAKLDGFSRRRGAIRLGAGIIAQ
jgi:hypothetical protein